MLAQIAAKIKVFKRFDLIAKSSRFLELQFPGGRLHFPTQFLEQTFFFAVEEQPQSANLATIVFAADPLVAWSRTLMNARQQARAEPAPSFIRFFDIQSAGTKLKNLLQDSDRSPQPFGIRERTVELCPARTGFPSELDSGKFFSNKNFQIRKGFVVLQFLIETRLNILDQPRFKQQSIDFAVGDDVVKVPDFQDQFGCSKIFCCLFREITSGTVPQIHRFADVNDTSAIIFHQIHAGRRGKRFDLFPRIVVRRKGGVGVGHPSNFPACCMLVNLSPPGLHTTMARIGWGSIWIRTHSMSWN